MLAFRVEIQCTCPHGSIFISSHLDKDWKRKKQSHRSLWASDYLFIYECSSLWPSPHNTSFVAEDVCAVLYLHKRNFNCHRLQLTPEGVCVCLYISRQVLFIYPCVKSAARWSHGLWPWEIPVDSLWYLQAFHLSTSDSWLLYSESRPLYCCAKAKCSNYIFGLWNWVSRQTMNCFVTFISFSVGKLTVLSL